MTISNRDELIDALQQDSEEFQEAVARLPEEAFERGVYEQGWNARQLLAHIAAIEWTYPRLIERAEQRAGGEDVPQGGGAGFDMDAYNANLLYRLTGYRPIQVAAVAARRPTGRATADGVPPQSGRDHRRDPSRRRRATQATDPLSRRRRGHAAGRARGRRRRPRQGREHVSDLLKGAQPD